LIGHGKSEHYTRKGIGGGCGNGEKKRSEKNKTKV